MAANPSQLQLLPPNPIPNKDQQRIHPDEVDKVRMLASIGGNGIRIRDSSKTTPDSSFSHTPAERAGTSSVHFTMHVMQKSCPKQWMGKGHYWQQLRGLVYLASMRHNAHTGHHILAPHGIATGAGCAATPHTSPLTRTSE